MVFMTTYDSFVRWRRHTVTSSVSLFVLWSCTLSLSLGDLSDVFSFLKSVQDKELWLGISEYLLVANIFPKNLDCRVSWQARVGSGKIISKEKDFQICPLPQNFA